MIIFENGNKCVHANVFYLRLQLVSWTNWRVHTTKLIRNVLNLCFFCVCLNLINYTCINNYITLQGHTHTHILISSTYEMLCFIIQIILKTEIKEINMDL